MKIFDVIIVGAGPTGTAAAAELKRAGMHCVLLDKVSFPRTKLCAGWVTPGVWELLGISPGEYPEGLIRFDADNPIIAHLGWYRHTIETPQYSVRRFEFDNWMLNRSEVERITHTVKRIEERNGVYVVDGQFRAPYIIGAGGTTDPVARALFPKDNRPENAKAVVNEKEYPYEWEDSRCHLFFFQGRSSVYGWYVPKYNKGEKYINVGIGGTSSQLKKQGTNIREQWNILMNRLVSDGFIPTPPKPDGHYYYAREHEKDAAPKVRNGNAFICGDALGGATRDMFEGIGPGVDTGQRAARAIIDPSEVYTLDGISRFTIEGWLMPRVLQAKFIPLRQ